MIRPLMLVALLLAPLTAGAQSITIETTPLTDEPETLPQPVDPAERGERGTGAVLRALDKVDGSTIDVELPEGQSVLMLGLEVGLSECRYPAGNPAGDAFAYIVIREQNPDGAVFAGWMVASSPALNALDHARYDVWVLRCITS